MDEIAVTGIVLSSMPYREKDKLIHLYSVELGKITAILKGVSTSNAKLKFAGQPFCFAKFELTASKDFYIVKGVELIDTFFDLTIDYDRYTLVSSMLEVCSFILKPGIISENLFLHLIKTLQNIIYNEIDYRLAVLKFYLSFLKIIGYGLNFSTCDNCGLSFVGDIKFDMETGTFRCINCSLGSKIEKRDFVNLKIIEATDISRLHTLKIKSEDLRSSLKLAILDISARLHIKIKSIDINNL